MPQYTDMGAKQHHDTTSAVKAVLAGMSIAGAARKFKVHRRTIERAINRDNPKVSKPRGRK